MSVVNTSLTPTIAIIGGGPAGLMAAEVLANAGVQVDVYDAMASVGRKFLMAGKGGMNITHAEALDAFIGRYSARAAQLAPLLHDFGPTALREWVHGLGVDTFVGSSGRVFPTDMKAAPMLRAWLHRLRASGVRFHMRHRWIGWADAVAGGRGGLRLATPDGETVAHADAVILALGGGSWARLGSDGAWVPLLSARGVEIAPLRPANCGFDVDWSGHFRSRFAGAPVKNVAIGLAAEEAVGDGGVTHPAHYRQGEFVITEGGIEGSLVYALSAPMRDRLDTTGQAVIHVDLVPAIDAQRVVAEVMRPRGARSLSSHLQSRLGIEGVKAGLLREALSKAEMENGTRLAAAIKALPIRLARARPIDEVISSAGGVRFESLDANWMLKPLPGVFCAGEMLDWEAPTGGYLLTACFATGRAAGAGVLRWLGSRR